LIVEDYTPQADVVAMLLSSSGTHIEYKIAIAGNGSSAILALEENEFDIVLLDLGLPDINGLDLLRKIKTKWPNVEVIVLTGYDDIEIAVEAMKNGASEFLIKKDDAILNLPGILEKVMSKNTQE
jgi:DNA-binding NtrC family response regulator